MAYKYDPILCMMVEQPNVKTHDKAGEMWYLYVDGKSITAFESWGAPVKEAKEYMKKNNVKGVGTLKRIGRGGSFTITAKDKSTKTVDALAARDGMFSKTFAKYTSDARWKVQQGISELSKVDNKNQVDPVSKTYVKELNKILASIDEAFNVAASDYKAERDKIIEIIDQFNKDSRNIYKSMEVGVSVARKILSDSKDIHDKHLAMIEKVSDLDTFYRLSDKTRLAYDKLLSDLDKMPETFQRQFAEVYKLVSKHRLDTIKADSKKFKALKGR